jgi:hypothetical protein
MEVILPANSFILLVRAVLGHAGCHSSYWVGMCVSMWGEGHIRQVFSSRVVSPLELVVASRGSVLGGGGGTAGSQLQTSV